MPDRQAALEQAFLILRQVTRVPWTGQEATDWWDRRILTIAAVERAAPEDEFNPRDEDVKQLLRLQTRLDEAREAIRLAHRLLTTHLHANGPCQTCDWLVLPAVIGATKEARR